VPVSASEGHTAQVGPYVRAPDDDHHGQQHPPVEVPLGGEYDNAGQCERQGDVQQGGQYKRSGAVGFPLAGIKHGHENQGYQHRQYQQPLPVQAVAAAQERQQESEDACDYGNGLCGLFVRSYGDSEVFGHHYRHREDEQYGVCGRMPQQGRQEEGQEDCPAKRSGQQVLHEALRYLRWRMLHQWRPHLLRQWLQRLPRR